MVTTNTNRTRFADEAAELDTAMFTAHWVLHKLLNYPLALLRLTNTGPFGKLARETCVAYLDDILSDPDKTRVDNVGDHHQGVAATKMLIARLSGSNPKLNTVELQKLFETLPPETVADAFDSFTPPMLAGTWTEKEKLEQYRQLIRNLIERYEQKLDRRQREKEEKGGGDKYSPMGSVMSMQATPFSEPSANRSYGFTKENAPKIGKIIDDLEKQIGKTF